MEKYIPKSIVLAEIEKRRDSALKRQRSLEAIGQGSVFNEMIAHELNRIISFINSLPNTYLNLKHRKKIMV